MELFNELTVLKMTNPITKREIRLKMRNLYKQGSITKYRAFIKSCRKMGIEPIINVVEA